MGKACATLLVPAAPTALVVQGPQVQKTEAISSRKGRSEEARPDVWLGAIWLPLMLPPSL